MKNFYLLPFIFFSFIHGLQAKLNASVLQFNNDSCFVADTLNLSTNCNPENFVLNTLGSAGLDSACNGDADDAKWFVFEATYPNIVIEVNTSAEINAVIQLFTGPDCDNLTALQCVNETGLGSDELLLYYGLNVGEYYFFRVFDGSTGIPIDSTFSVCIYHAPCPDVTISASGPLVFCSGENVILTASEGDFYNWNTSSNQQSITVTTSGNYFVTVIDFQTGCASTSASVSVSVNPLPPNFVSISGSTTICEGESVNLSAVFGASLTYQWRKNGVNIAGETNRIFSATETGTFSVIVTNSSTDCSSISNGINVTALAPPNTDYTHTNPTQVCGFTNVNLAVAFQPNVNYQWFRNDTLISGAFANTFAPAVSGQYTVQLTNAACTVFSAIQQVDFFDFPNATFPSGDSALICETNETFIIADPIGGATYIWYRNNALLNNETESFIFTGIAGAYSFTVTDTNGCASNSGTFNLTVVQNPELELITPILSACQGDSLLLIASADRAVSVTWQRNGLPFVDLDLDSIYTTVSGSFRFIAIDELGCEAISDETVLTINPLPIVNIIPGQFPVCSGSEVLLSATEQIGWNYTWYLNEEIIENADSSRYLAVEEGNYYVLVVDQQNCQGNSEILNIAYFNAPEEPLLTSIDSLSFCEGGSASLVISNFNEAFDYQWFYNDLAIEETNGIFYDAFISGNYKVSVLDENGCSSISDVLTIEVFSNPEVSLFLPIELICNTSGTATLSGGTPLGGFYLGTGVSGLNLDLSQYSAPAIAEITYTYTDINGCSGAAVDSISIENCVNVNEILSSAYLIYPNPTSDLLYLNKEASNFDFMQIIDRNGALVFSQIDIRNAVFPINIAHLKPGTYFVQFSNNQKLITRKLVKI